MGKSKNWKVIRKDEDVHVPVHLHVVWLPPRDGDEAILRTVMPQDKESEQYYQLTEDTDASRQGIGAVLSADRGHGYLKTRNRSSTIS